MSLFASGRRRTKRFKACSCCFFVGRSASKAHERQYLKIVTCPLQKAQTQSGKTLQNADCIPTATVTAWQRTGCSLFSGTHFQVFFLDSAAVWLNGLRAGISRCLVILYFATLQAEIVSERVPPFLSPCPSTGRLSSKPRSQFLWLPQQLRGLPRHPGRTSTTCCRSPAT